MNKVPAKEWPKGSKRPLYLYKGDYPALISKDRGATWHPDNLEGTPEQLAAWGQESVITGYIPQVLTPYKSLAVVVLKASMIKSFVFHMRLLTIDLLCIFICEDILYLRNIPSFTQ